MNAIQELNKLHKDKYGVEPNVIGYLWDDMDEQFNLLVKAVEGDKPYDEYQMLSKDEQKDFDKGELLF